MSKHKHNRGQNQQPQQAKPAQPEVRNDDVVVSAPEVTPESVEDLLAVATGAEIETVAEEPEAEVKTEVKEPVAQPEVKTIEPVAEQIAKVAPTQKVAEPVKAAPTVTEVKQPVKKVINRVEAEDIYPSVNPIMRKMMNIPNREHTPAGKRLKQMFDEYKAMMSNPTTDKLELKKRVMKLYQVMSAGCPTSLSDAIVAQDLVRVSFDCLVDGWGTVYTDSNMFCLDYTLPGGAAAIDKLNMYWQAMIQLVEGAVEGERIMFDVDRLAIVLKNPVVTSAIAKMKNNILERNKRAAENK